MEIHMKESTFMRPAQETPKHSLWLSNLDLLFDVVHTPTVYFYRPPPNGSSNFFESSLLKQALSKVLVPFYPIAGRLGRDENGRLEIQCNEEGVLFIEAETSCDIDDLGDFTPSFKIQQLVPTVDYSIDVSSYPLLALQVTHFKCGGVCLGVLWLHTLGDGTSALNFINTWAGMTRGIPITIPPFLDRTILRATSPHPTFHHIEYESPSTMNIHSQTKESRSNPQSTSIAIVKISLDQINTLKAKSKKDETNIRFSTFEILAGHIWRCVCKARGLSDDQLSKLYIPIDARSRLNPPLPNGYFGNAVFVCTPTISSGDVQSKPLISTMETIRTELKRIDDKYLKSALAYIEQQPDPTILRRGAHTFNSPNLNIVSWIRLPIHDADFGWGRPMYMGPATVLVEGRVYILPSPTDDGSLSLIIRLETPQMQQIFKKCFYDL